MTGRHSHSHRKKNSDNPANICLSKVNRKQKFLLGENGLFLDPKCVGIKGLLLLLTCYFILVVVLVLVFVFLSYF